MGKKSIFSVNKNKLVIAYYLVLTAVLFYIIRPNIVFPMSIRIPLLAAILLPAIFNVWFLPAVMVLFYGIEASSFASILPTSDFYYILIVVFAFALHYKPSKLLHKELIVLLFFFILSFLHFDFRQVLLWGFIALLLGDMVKTKNDLQPLAYAFIALTIFLSALFLIYKGEFAVNYGDEDLGLERSNWINPNVFGACISAGGVIASAYLTKALRITRTRLGMVLSIAAIVLASFCLPLNASRGALMSFVIPSLVFVLISDLAKWKKVLFLSAFVAGVWWLYQSGYFDLLLYRIEEDDNGTSNRNVIWANKLADFFSNGNLFDLIIGIGQTACVHIGTGFFGAGWSTHNDFVTAFIAYGLIGLLVFVFSVFVYPVRKALPGNKGTVFVLLIYLIVEGFVLEPIFRGYFTEIMFFIFVLKYALIVKSSPKKKVLIEKKEYKREIAAYHAQLRKQTKECGRMKLSEPLTWSPSTDINKRVGTNPPSQPRGDWFKEEELPAADAVSVADEPQQRQEPQQHQTEPKPQPEAKKDAPKRFPKWAAVLLSVVVIGVGCYVISSVVMQKDEPLEDVQELAEEAGKEKSLASEEPVATDEPEWEKYNKMDYRLTNGGYYIMGLDRIVKARAGDNTKKIAKRVYGRADGCCYIEIYNGIKPKTKLQKGMEIKIPKLESKRSVRMRLEQQTKE